jgi:hypothetical protein
MMEVELGIYKHYKGKLYQVLSLARHSETLEEYIVYQALYGKYGVWIRPAMMFLEEVEINGVKKPRFEFQYHNKSKPPEID